MKRAVSIALLLVGVCAGIVAAPSSASAAPVTCVGGTSGARAKLTKAMRTAVANDRKPSTLRIALRDGRTGVECGYQAQSRIYTRSVIKVALSAALIRMRHKQGRPVTKREYSYMNAAITRSVNAAGQALYNRLGSDAPLRNLFLSLGVNGIKYSGDGRWGNTRLSAAQHIKFLQGLTDGTNRGLPLSGKLYLIDRMHNLINKQVWGVGIGVPPGTYFALKGGWGPSQSQPGYIVNSIGVVRPKTGGQYEMAILTNRNKSEAIGKRRLNQVARVMNAAL